MARRGQVDMERLWELSQKGYTADRLMNELDMKDRAQLKNALEELLREKGENDVLRGLIGQASLDESQHMDGL